VSAWTGEELSSKKRTGIEKGVLNGEIAEMFRHPLCATLRGLESHIPLPLPFRS